MAERTEYLTQRQLRVLRALEGADEPLQYRGIAELTGVEIGLVRPIISILRSRGLVSAVPGEGYIVPEESLMSAESWKSFAASGFSHLERGEALGPPPHRPESHLDAPLTEVLASLRPETRLYPEVYAWLLADATKLLTPQISRCKCSCGSIRVQYPDGSTVCYVREPDGHTHLRKIASLDEAQRRFSVREQGSGSETLSFVASRRDATRLFAPFKEASPSLELFDEEYGEVVA